MKKLSFAVAFVAMSLVSIGVFAQEVEEAVEVVEATQDEVIEIQVTELPEAVTSAIANDLAEYKAEKAFKTMVSEKEAFWVVLSKEETKIKVLFNAEGKVIEQNDSEL